MAFKNFDGFLFSYYFFTKVLTYSRNRVCQWSVFFSCTVHYYIYCTSHWLLKDAGKNPLDSTRLSGYIFLTIIACCQLVFWSSKLSMKACQSRFNKVISWNKSKLVFDSIYKPGSKKLKPLAYMQKIPIFDFIGYKKNRMFNWVQRFWLICNT